MDLVAGGAVYHGVVVPGIDPPQEFRCPQHRPGMILSRDLSPFDQSIQLVIIELIKVPGLLDELLGVDGPEIFQRDACHFRQQLHECGFVLRRQQPSAIRCEFGHALPLQ